MVKNKLIQTAIVALFVLGTISCKDQLDIGNPNSPSAIPNSEAAILELATGGIYVNGFLNGDGWLGNSYFSLPMGYNELLADNVGASASNNQVTTVGQPDYIILDDGSKRSNTSPSVGILRTYNNRPATGANNNAIHYQWLNMYAMNNACNLTLSLVDDIPYATDAETKIATIKAWCYFWKGYAYASIGSKYFSGLVVNEYGVISSTYVSHDAIIAESDKYFKLAASTLDGITSAGVYGTILGRLIPSQNQTGNGGVPSIAEWKRNINTLMARNLLFNKLSPFVNDNPAATITGSSMSGTMTSADWATIKALTADGIKKGDVIFTGRTTGTNDFFSASGGTVNSLTANPASTSTFKPSERALQNFNDGDLRFKRNFTEADPYSNDYVYGVRFTLMNHADVLADDSLSAIDDSLSGTFIYADKRVGEFELILAGSYEENALMLAEANIRTGDIEGGLIIIDAVRSYLGANNVDKDGILTGAEPVANTGLTQAEALNELTKERRVSLLFRGLSFYDNRRWGWTYDISKGGGSYHNTVVTGDEINTNVIINYNFMDYWDVPASESVLNPAGEGSIVSVGSIEIKNPNYN